MQVIFYVTFIGNTSGSTFYIAIKKNHYHLIYAHIASVSRNQLRVRAYSLHSPSVKERKERCWSRRLWKLTLPREALSDELCVWDCPVYLHLSTKETMFLLSLNNCGIWTLEHGLTSKKICIKGSTYFCLTKFAYYIRERRSSQKLSRLVTFLKKLPRNHTILFVLEVTFHLSCNKQLLLRSMKIQYLWFS